MPDKNKQSLSHLLQALMDKPDNASMMDLLESAHLGFTQGANHFVENCDENSAEKLQPADIKNCLRTYPIAQILISIVRYHELNRDTEIIRKTVLALLDSLEEQIPSGSDREQPMQTTLH